MEAKADLATIVISTHKKLWEGAFGDLKEWIDKKKSIQPNRLPCSAISMVMGTK